MTHDTERLAVIIERIREINAMQASAEYKLNSLVGFIEGITGERI